LTGDKHRLPLFLFALTMPLLPLLGLSMLSDGCGIAFFMAALWQYRQGHMGRCGILMGMVLTCRPSFLIPIAAFMLYEIIKQRGAYKLLGACAGICLFFFGAVFVIEGKPLLWEAWRFIEGHFFLWGNTTISETNQSRTWLETLSDYQGGTALAITTCILFLYGVTQRKISAIFILCCAAWGWTILFQNPENLRHLALPVLLTGVLVGGRYVLVGASVIQAIITLLYVQYPVQPAPLEQVARYIEKQPQTNILTNYGVATLRSRLPDHQIYDAYYEQYLPAGKIRLTSTKTEEARVFKGQVFGEKIFFLYREE